MLNPIPHLTAQLDLPPARFLDRSIAVLHRAAAETKARGQGQCVESEACEIVGFCQLFLISETVFPIRGRPGKASHHPRLLRDSDPQQIPPESPSLDVGRTCVFKLNPSCCCSVPAYSPCGLRQMSSSIISSHHQTLEQAVADVVSSRNPCPMPACQQSSGRLSVLLRSLQFCLDATSPVVPCKNHRTPSSFQGQR